MTLLSNATDIYDEIEALKAREDATILAHYYQDGEIQEIADFTGDSLKLARAATTVESSTIVFCGVHFMAETAKMLNPEKRVCCPTSAPVAASPTVAPPRRWPAGRSSSGPRGAGSRR